MAMPVKVSEAQIQGAKTVRRKVVRMPTCTLRKGCSLPAVSLRTIANTMS